MIIIKISGGLGNQMFQYAFYHMVKKQFKDVKVDNSFYKRIKQHNGYELENIFGIHVPIATEREIRSLKANSWNKIRRTSEILFGYPNSVYNQEWGNQYCQDFLRDDCYYNGVWMNLKYYEHCMEEIKNLYAWHKPLSERNQEIMMQMRETDSVAVHIRRGDYVNNAVHGGVCELAYYKRAFKLIEERVSNPGYFLFSDDPDWVKENLPVNSGVIVSWNAGEDSNLDMLLMSQAKHNIIANSTFSWWSAFLNKNVGQIVIGPKYWYQHEINESKHETADALMLPEWLQV